MKITAIASTLFLVSAAGAVAADAGQHPIINASVPADISYGIAVKASADIMLCDVDRYNLTLLRDLAAEKAASVSGRPKLEIEIEAKRAADKIRDDARSRENGVREYCSTDEIGDYWLAWTTPLETRIVVDHLHQLRMERGEAVLALDICDLDAEETKAVKDFMRASKSWAERVSGTDFVTTGHASLKAVLKSIVDREEFCTSYRETIRGYGAHPILDIEEEIR